jgi:hypothetical protein
MQLNYLGVLTFKYFFQTASEAVTSQVFHFHWNPLVALQAIIVS